MLFQRDVPDPRLAERQHVLVRSADRLLRQPGDQLARLLDQRACRIKLLGIERLPATALEQVLRSKPHLVSQLAGLVMRDATPAGGIEPADPLLHLVDQLRHVLRVLEPVEIDVAELATDDARAILISGVRRAVGLQIVERDILAAILDKGRTIVRRLFDHPALRLGSVEPVYFVQILGMEVTLRSRAFRVKPIDQVIRRRAIMELGEITLLP